MSLIIDYESDDYRFYKELNEDVQLKPTSSKHWDIQIENGDYVNVAGERSLENAIVIAIMTRFNELDRGLYDGFGCKIHDFVKALKSDMLVYEIELSVKEVLEKMRRIHKVNWIEITDSKDCNYHVCFSVTSIDDEIVKGELNV